MNFGVTNKPKRLGNKRDEGLFKSSESYSCKPKTPLKLSPSSAQTKIYQKEFRNKNAGDAESQL
jgi:hypothetical protein